MTQPDKYAWLKDAAAELHKLADSARECWATAQAAEEFCSSDDEEKRHLGTRLAQASANLAKQLVRDLDELAEIVGAPEGSEA